MTDTRRAEATDLAGAWHTLIARHSAAPAATDIGAALLADWRQPHRRYHTVTHLRDVLTHVDELADHADDPVAVRLAAWYHDAVYDGAPDDEERSAQRAETELTTLGLTPALVAEVSRLVRLTATHDPAPGDRNGDTLSDADLAILAAPAEKYRAYSAAVRAEYAHVPHQAFAAGRATILQAMLDAPALYRTPHARQHWETQARSNLRTELDYLGTAAGSS
jgi:predicted metal-dependent HD superfamily phosphohydrolase